MEVAKDRLTAAAFEELAMPLFDQLYNFAHWLTKERSEAEDLVQETYAKALRGLASFQPGKRGLAFDSHWHSDVASITRPESTARTPSEETRGITMADEFTAKLDAYLDGELPSSEMKAIDAHVRGCPPCAADVLIRVQMKRAVQAAGKRYNPSPEFRQRIQQQITSRPRLWLPRAWMGVSAVLAALLITVLLSSYVGR